MKKNAAKILACVAPRLSNSIHFSALSVAAPSSVLRIKPTNLVERSKFARAFSSQSEHVERVPSLGDSISEGTVVQILKDVGDYVHADEVFLVLETDKVAVDIRATKSGKITHFDVKQDDTVKVGGDLARIDTSAAPPAEKKAEEPKADKADKAEPAQAAPAEKPQAQEAPKAPSTPPKAAPAPPKPAPVVAVGGGAPSRQERRVPATRMRLTIATRMKEAQNTSASLTTFNEIDMTNLMQLREKVKDEFAEVHGVKLGFMSVFVKAAAAALQKFPDVNAFLDGKEIVYRDYVDISVAVATPTGLVVPVLRNCEHMSFSQVEANIAALGDKARKGQIAIEDMVGGTFTISNGGVFGSLMGTPILNLPQSAILGMHGIFKRPVAVGDKVEIRPMMYVALTYDHRMIDGSTAVRFLRSIKSSIEDPNRLLLGL